MALLAKFKEVPAALMASVRRAAKKPREANPIESPEALVKPLYDECRAQGIADLAEAVVVGAVDGTRVQALARVEHAVQVAVRVYR
ncbi:MAG: hypothetical protein AB7E55_12800 [Pigmentiphaga sp.]